MRTIFEPDFEDLIRIFNQYKVRFVLVGGLAVVFHGHFRTTKDMDLFYEATLENVNNIKAALKEFGFGFLNLTTEDLMDKKGYVQLGREPARIDMFCDLPGITFEEVWNSAVLYQEEQLEMKVIHINHLIQNKEAVGRPQDIDDVRKLKKIMNKRK